MFASLTAEKLVNDLFNAGLFIMIARLVMSLGMGFTVAQVLAPLRRVRVVAVALVLNVLVVPAIAWGLAKLFPITGEQVIGIEFGRRGRGQRTATNSIDRERRAAV